MVSIKETLMISIENYPTIPFIEDPVTWRKRWIEAPTHIIGGDFYHFRFTNLKGETPKGIIPTKNPSTITATSGKTNLQQVQLLQRQLPALPWQLFSFSLALLLCLYWQSRLWEMKEIKGKSKTWGKVKKSKLSARHLTNQFQFCFR